MGTTVVILCIFLVMEMLLYSLVLFKIRKRAIQILRYSEYTTLAILNYSVIVALMEQYVDILQREDVPSHLENELFLDIERHYQEVRSHLEIALSHYNPDKLDLNTIVPPLTITRQSRKKS